MKLAGLGTALAVVYTAVAQGKHIKVYADETRPRLQGAKLTAWELQKLGVPSTLITDNAAAFLMQQGRVNAVLVGADRITLNGDVANKVGTYGLAVVAKHHGVPLYVAAPTSTFDFEMVDGKDIPIEQRSGREVTHIGDTQIAPDDVTVYSPAFDITPHELVSAIITDQGVLRDPYRPEIEALKAKWESSLSAKASF